MRQSSRQRATQWPQHVVRSFCFTRLLPRYFYFSNSLTNKSALAKTMRSYALEQGVSVPQLDYLPATFVLRPGGELMDERQQFLAEFERQEKIIAASAPHSDSVSADDPSAIAATPRNAWIVKANRGAKGSSIFVSDNAAELLAYVDAQGERQRGH